jgi:hypothetical protein
MGFFADIQDAAGLEARQQHCEQAEPVSVLPDARQDAPQQNTAPSIQEPAQPAAPKPEPAAPVQRPEPTATPQPVFTQMDDSEAVAASVKRIKADIERITRRNMKECVAAYLEDLCAKDPAFARTVIQPKKNMVNCFRYITRKARDYAERERQDTGVTESGAYGTDIPDDLCYQWAVDYFNDPNADEERKPQPRPTPAAKPKDKPATPAKPKPAPVTCGEGCEQMTLLGAMK